MKKEKNNYLDLVPIKNKEITWQVIDKGIVILEVERNGLFDKIAQMFFKRPKKSNIKLDELGSFVWQCIDDKKNVFNIAEEIEKEFGDDRNLYERLIKFCNILKDNKFILFKS